MTANVEVSLKHFCDIFEILYGLFFTGYFFHDGQIGVFLPAHHIFIGSPVSHIIYSLGESESDCGKLNLHFFSDDVHIVIHLQITESYALFHELKKLSQEGGHLFDEDTLTDQPERVLAAEMIREKLLRLLDKEIPHGTAVVIERMRTRDESNIIDIDAVIYCERDSHKGIIIGKQGSMLKKIGTFARQDMENFFNCKVNLKMWVKVKEDWRNKQGLLRSFGYDKNDFED